jgi:asparagine synthase (glutamine-hydrolysing)
MCGFVGFLNGKFQGDSIDVAVESMADTLYHRGPDDSGVWTDHEAVAALAHRRLSILDLSSAGHQPMLSSSGRYVIAFNGEIYNHLELRKELDCRVSSALAMSGINRWRGHSDTETLLAAFESWGVAVTLSKTVGMFAIALWDRQTRTLSLARDRFGEKPLYYGWVNSAFVFGSELKALRAYPEFNNSVCRDSLSQYLRFMYVPAPLSIYRGIYKLEPGCLLTLKGTLPLTAPSHPLSADSVYESVSVSRWWSMADLVEKCLKDPLRDEAAALELLEQRLKASVQLQSLADVPLGGFLSGGVDSSTIVALMQQQSSRPVKTFTVGFEEAGFDESPHAKAVADHLGTDHTELFVRVSEARDVIPQLPQMYDEPFADSSQIPTHLVCRAARQQVVVALSGDAGDELFGGYNRYFWGLRMWDKVSWLPFAARRVLGNAIQRVPVDGWDALSSLGSGRDVVRLGEKAHKLAARLSSVRTMDELYLSLVNEWQQFDALVPGASGTFTGLPSLPDVPMDDARAKMMYWDSLTYLPDDILCKVDRAAMAISLETRVPFLDHRVAEIAWRLPMSMKIRGNEGKWALRQILYRHVPRELIERPKAGFGIPVGQWLRGSLREWCEALLDPSRLLREGFFDPVPVRKIWHQHLSGRYDWTGRLWSILMFQAWLEQNN